MAEHVTAQTITSLGSLQVNKRFSVNILAICTTITDALRLLRETFVASEGLDAVASGSTLSRFFATWVDGCRPDSSPKSTAHLLLHQNVLPYFNVIHLQTYLRLLSLFRWHSTAAEAASAVT